MRSCCVRDQMPTYIIDSNYRQQNTGIPAFNMLLLLMMELVAINFVFGAIALQEKRLSNLDGSKHSSCFLARSPSTPEMGETVEIAEYRPYVTCFTGSEIRNRRDAGLSFLGNRSIYLVRSRCGIFAAFVSSLLCSDCLNSYMYHTLHDVKSIFRVMSYRLVANEILQYLMCRVTRSTIHCRPSEGAHASSSCRHRLRQRG